MEKEKGQNRRKKEKARERDQSVDVLLAEDLIINQNVRRREAEKA